MRRNEITPLTSWLYRNDKENPLFDELWEVLKQSGSHPKNEVQGLTPSLTKRIEELKNRIK